MHLVSFINKLGDTPNALCFNHITRICLCDIFMSEISNQVKESKPRVLICFLYMNLQWAIHTKVQTSKKLLMTFLNTPRLLIIKVFCQSLLQHHRATLLWASWQHRLDPAIDDRVSVKIHSDGLVRWSWNPYQLMPKHAGSLQSHTMTKYFLFSILPISNTQ